MASFSTVRSMTVVDDPSGILYVTNTPESAGRFVCPKTNISALRAFEPLVKCRPLGPFRSIVDMKQHLPIQRNTIVQARD